MRLRSQILGRLVAAAGALIVGVSLAAAQGRPNILWISSEDNGPHIGAYGDRDASTPTLDALARRGARFTRAWAAAPVCAPSRTAIITAVLPQTTGGMHMRSEVPLPPDVQMFPVLLRAAGYYTSNNVKEDYNHPTPPGVWDDSSATAHWRKRREGQPFFAVFNLVTTHESQIRKRPHTPVHDPAQVRVPPYHPDTPEVRQDWAQYHDKMTEMDGEVAQRLRELDADGLAASTVVVYWGDHGIGLPRGKRWLYPCTCPSGSRRWRPTATRPARHRRSWSACWISVHRRCRWLAFGRRPGCRGAPSWASIARRREPGCQPVAIAWTNASTCRGRFGTIATCTCATSGRIAPRGSTWLTCSRRRRPRSGRRDTTPAS
jgi:arylsulfatase A-like enzyme